MGMWSGKLAEIDPQYLVVTEGSNVSFVSENDERGQVGTHPRLAHVLAFGLVATNNPVPEDLIEAAAQSLTLKGQDQLRRSLTSHNALYERLPEMYSLARENVLGLIGYHADGGATTQQEADLRKARLQVATVSLLTSDFR